MPLSNRRPLYSESDLRDGTAPGPAGAGGTAALDGGGIPLSPPHDLAAGGALDEAPVLFTKQPCAVKGAAAALSAGVLGYLFGFIPGMVRHRASKWALIHLDGMRSAQSLALMSGAYTAVHCICSRIRQVEDGWNRGLAGCATGLALGWGNGPAGALQSCIGIGGLSYLIDFGGGAADAAVLPGSHSGGAEASGRRRGAPDGGAAGASSSGRNAGGASGQQQQQQQWWQMPQQHREELEARMRAFMALPPVAFLGEACRSVYFDGCGCGSSAGSGGVGGGCSAWGSAVAVPSQQRRG